MKTELLKGFGLTEEQIAEVMKENGKDVEAAKAKYGDYEDLKAQLAEAGKTIEGFRAMDIDGVKMAAEEWKQKAEQAEKDAEKKIADMKFDALLTGAITSAKGRSPKAVMALLDLDALRASKNQEADLGAALENLKKESGYLFEDQSTPPPYAPGTGTAPTGGMTREAFDKLGYRDRVALKQASPELYEQMKKE